MKLPRRALPALLAFPALARAAGFPDRPVRLVVPFAPGGNADTVGRVLAPKISEVLGQPVVVENRAGAAGNVAATAFARAKPDGYSLLLGSNGPLAVNPVTQANLGYDPMRDFAPLGLAVRTPNVLAVHKAVPVQTLAELIALAKAQPGRIACGSSGTGSTAHLAIETFNAMTGAGLQHVPYGSGGAMAPDLVAGNIQSGMTEISTALPLHREGAIRILGAGSAARLPVAPDIPTMEEQGVHGFRAAAFLGLVVPVGTPPEVMAKLAAALAAAVADPPTRKRFEEMGSEMASAEEATPAGFAAFLERELTWTRAAAERAGLRPS
ncbi:tripartite tricarboxylate transporter substrate binding protein [Siccirubricoccus sp. KC 17139]|uniref:Tripartite tricarboxylate transporter substrate binding protein n=1 Tax=Siccirubricoccus soli TaxID=2899147 RepID=A0ABT1DDP7_9PROT|nr:tripartite tricarboxylate transporter substrate binding protein [Siccirubricoccus soli]MCO6419324.1 tripartite tricarboxylate transporter substrate binding protein [Siccirubricoccus soli]MCP2685459.1 tripartite tricarboxylate transporter substrate binding protein [Siccirubricoccus soli]